MERYRGLDLLRLLAGMMVVMLHYNYGWAFKEINEIPEINRWLLYLMETISIPAVNIFMIISGFFLYRVDRRNIGKILSLFIFAICFKEFFYFTFHILKPPITIHGIINSLIPRYYFIVLYSVVYFLSPCVNICIRCLSEKGISCLFVLLFLLLSLEPWLIDIMTTTTTNDWRGMSTISFNGGDGGQTLVNFFLLYIIGAMINRIKLPDYQLIKWGGLYVVSSVVIFITYLLNQKELVSYYNPFVIIQTICLFHFFKNVGCWPVFSKLSKAAFTCYIIHWNFLSLLKIKSFLYGPWYVLLLHIIASLTIIYLLSYIVMVVWNKLFSKVNIKLKELEINLN